MRILVVTPEGEIGGSERWVLEVIPPESLFLVLRNGPLVDELRRRGGKVIVKDVGKSPHGLLRAVRACRGMLRRGQVDVVLVNGVKAGLVGVPAALPERIPTVLAKHGSFLDRSVGRLVAAACVRSVAVSSAMASTLPRDRTCVIPPVTPARAQYPRVPEERSPLVLGMVTRLVPEKGVDMALRGAAAAGGWDVRVAGPSANAEPEVRRLQDLAHDLGVTLQLTGEVPDSAGFLRSCDAAAVLSRPHRGGGPAEGFGLVVPEAAAQGVPVVTDPSRVPSAVAMGGRGILPVDSSSEKSIAAALTALKDVALRARLGAQGWEATGELPGREEIRSRVLRVLEEAHQ